MLSLEKAKKIKWHCFNKRKRSLFFRSLIIVGLTNQTLNLGVDYTLSHWLSVDGWNICPESEFQRIRRELLDRLKKDPYFLMNLFEQYSKLYRKSLEYWNKIQNSDFSSLENTVLVKAMEDFYYGHLEMTGFLILPLYIEDDLEDAVKQELTKIFNKESLKAYETLTLPILKSTIVLESEERLKIKTNEDLTKHWLKYRWISDTLLFFDYLPKQYFRQESGISSLESSDFSYYYRQIKNKKTRTLIDTIQKSIWFRNFRLEAVYHSTYLIQNLFEEITHRLKLKKGDLLFLSPLEISSALRGSALDNKEISNRKKEYVIIGERGEDQRVLSERFAKRWIKELNPSFLKEKSNVINGQPAYRGIIMGKVVLVETLNDFKKPAFSSKDLILVTHSTTPKYVPFLKNVSAIVTDEGGLTCHAAIISRELRIPCVVGTKIATKVLKDGDMVEADANKGIVRKINE